MPANGRVHWPFKRNPTAAYRKVHCNASARIMKLRLKRRPAMAERSKRGEDRPAVRPAGGGCGPDPARSTPLVSYFPVNHLS
jgi:hypothetical protein